MALNQVQQVALELLKHKDISVKEAYVLASEFLNETGYLSETQPLEVDVKFQAGMSDFERWSVDMHCKELNVGVATCVKAPKARVFDIAKSRMEAAINDKLAQSSKKAGEIKYIDHDDIRQWM